MLGAACGSSTENAGDADPPRALAPWVAAEFPTGLLAESDGSVLFVERLTGRVRRVDAAGRLDPEPVAVLDTVGAPDDQRGALDLLRLGDGRLLASWTQSEDGRLVVGVVDVVPTVLWVGPVSADRANGGALAESRDGSVLVTVGDLLAPDDPPATATDPRSMVLRIDPNGSPDQTATIVSTGWNNPYAMVTDGDGITWVADNSGGSAPERFGRADRSAADAVELPGPQIAPSALVDLGAGRLGLCSFLRQQMIEIDTSGATPRLDRQATVAPCSIGAVVIGDRVVTATPTGLFVGDRPVT